MGFLDKLTKAGRAITGGAAVVSIQYPLRVMRVGEWIVVRVTVHTRDYDVQSGGVFVDIMAKEEGEVESGIDNNDTTVHHKTVDLSFPLSPPVVLAANDRRVFDGRVRIPNGEPTYHGMIDHQWYIRGRLEAFGNDPDSGFKEIIVSKY